MLEITKEEDGNGFDRSRLEDLLKQKFFYDQSFSIYGGKCDTQHVLLKLCCGLRILTIPVYKIVQ